MTHYINSVKLTINITQGETQYDWHLVLVDGILYFSRPFALIMQICYNNQCTAAEPVSLMHSNE